MPVHDWTQVEAGIFHHFHGAWIDSNARLLNSRLGPDYYALGEQIAGGYGPDVLTLQVPSNGHPKSPGAPGGSVAVAERVPRVKWHLVSEADRYAARAKAIMIRHSSNHRVVAVIEIVSPGSKNSQIGFSSFVSKAIELLMAGIHLVIIDLFPPGPRDPRGIHPPIWSRFSQQEYEPTLDEPLTLVSYCADRVPEAYLEPTAIGRELAEMPVFLEVGGYVPLPLEATYMSAWEAVPRYWQQVIEKG